MDRRLLIGSAGFASLAGASALLYSISPAFWRQFAQEWERPVADPPGKPDPKHWPDQGLFAAWLGHSTVLLKIDGMTILTDPMFSKRAGLGIGPMTIGIKRLVAPALEVSKLPHIDLVLLSHAHMDHFDLPSLRALENSGTTVVTAKSTSDLLRVNHWGGVRELLWGESARVASAEVRAFEVNHWGARMRTDLYRGYNGYTIEAGRYRVLFGGDTAMTDAFAGVRSSRPFDLAIMPIGAYNPWIRFHCTPEQAWKMGEMAGADRFLPVHHQTFNLGRESYHEPIGRFLDSAGSQPDRVVLREIGGEFRFA